MRRSSRSLAQFEEGALGEFQHLQRLLARYGGKIVQELIKGEASFEVAD